MRLLQKCCVLFLLAAALCCSACDLDSRYDSEFFAMDTVMTITAYGSKSEDAVKSAENEINRLDALFSVQNEDSEICKLNRSKSITASPDTLALLKRANEVYTLTDGAFDITAEPITRIWGFYSGIENRVPSPQEIAGALKSVGAEHIKISGRSVALDKNTSVDLGGIAKGYSAAAAAQILREEGIDSALLSLGGNVRVIGSKPDGSDWNVAITDPDDNTKEIGTLAISNAAVVTSGGYQRCFEENGKIYHHIMDPDTGYPASGGLKSVTVISRDDALADGLSTALFVMGFEKARSLYSENSALFEGVFITDEDDIYITPNLKDIFSSQHNYEVIEI